MGGLLLMLFFYGGGFWLALRAVRAFEVGRGRPNDLEGLADEIEALREDQQRLGRSITALRDGREFTRQLQDRPGSEG